MSKYIIELNDKCARGIVVFGKTDEGVISTTQYVENLEVLNSDYINEHYGDLQDTAYQRGLEDGKAQSELGCEGCKYEGKTGEHLPCDYCTNNFKNQWTAKQTNENIKRGDVVRNKNNGLIYIVTLASDYGYVLLGSDGNFATSCITNTFEKTGRHFDIASILEEMRHD